jgi:hypothetical protein
MNTKSKFALAKTTKTCPKLTLHAVASTSQSASQPACAFILFHPRIIHFVIIESPPKSGAQIRKNDE